MRGVFVADILRFQISHAPLYYFCKVMHDVNARLLFKILFKANIEKCTEMKQGN